MKKIKFIDSGKFKSEHCILDVTCTFDLNIDTKDSFRKMLKFNTERDKHLKLNFEKYLPMGV